jgi:hypothetical protein
MADSFLHDDRDQPFLLPPDLRDWLPEGHLAWFILDVVDSAEGSLDRCIEVAERCAREPSTTTGLDILAKLLLGRYQPWDRTGRNRLIIRRLRVGASVSHGTCCRTSPL